MIEPLGLRRLSKDDCRDELAKLISPTIIAKLSPREHYALLEAAKVRLRYSIAGLAVGMGAPKWFRCGLFRHVCSQATDQELIELAPAVTGLFPPSDEIVFRRMGSRFGAEGLGVEPTLAALIVRREAMEKVPVHKTTKRRGKWVEVPLPGQCHRLHARCCPNGVKVRALPFETGSGKQLYLNP